MKIYSLEGAGNFFNKKIRHLCRIYKPEELGPLGVFFDALDQEGGEDAVHYFPFFMRFCPIFAIERPNDNKFLPE